MRTRRAFWGFLAAFAAAASAAPPPIPAVLIVQRRTPERYGQNFDVPITAKVAQTLDDEGRVTTILWALTDPVFRAAVEDKVLGNPKTNPALDEVFAAATKLRAQYVMMVTAVREKGMVKAEAALYRVDRVSKPIWQDTKTMTVMVGPDFDADATASSLGRTWLISLDLGPFKDLPTKRRDTPDMDRGQKPDPIEVAPTAKIDNRQLVEDAARLAKIGQGAQLVNLLRDAVDAEPFDIQRRRLLVDYLISQGRPELAADEAKRAAQVLPEAAEMHILAARAYLRSGEADLAQGELNEAIARDPDNFETRLLLGEISLEKLDAVAALDHFGKAVAKSATPDALYRRALANGLAGNPDAARADAAEARKTPQDGPTEEARYDLMVQMVDRATPDLASSLRSLIQRARVKPDDEVVKSELKKQTTLVGSVSSLLDLPSCPAKHRGSHDLRVLALNLLTQCVSQIDDAVQQKNDALLGEATINLGEALKQAAAAKDAYRSELQKSAG